MLAVIAAIVSSPGLRGTARRRRRFIRDACEKGADPAPLARVASRRTQGGDQAASLTSTNSSPSAATAWTISFCGVGLALEHRVGHGARVQRDRLRRVVVAGDHVVDADRRVVRVDHADDRDAELLGLGDGDLVEAHVDHEHRVGQRVHVLDAADVLLELDELALEHQRFLLDPDLGAGLDLRLHFLQALQRALDGLEVGQHAAEPALVDVRHAAALGLGRDHLARLALGADHQDRAAAARQLAHELHRVVEERLRLLEVDDVDLVPMAVDVRGHLGVPEAGLVSEMDAGFQHFTHRDRHRVSKGWF